MAERERGCTNNGARKEWIWTFEKLETLQQTSSFTIKKTLALQLLFLWVWEIVLISKQPALFHFKRRKTRQTYHKNINIAEYKKRAKQISFSTSNYLFPKDITSFSDVFTLEFFSFKYIYCKLQTHKKKSQKVFAAKIKN